MINLYVLARKSDDLAVAFRATDTYSDVEKDPDGAFYVEEKEVPDYFEEAPVKVSEIADRGCFINYPSGTCIDLPELNGWWKFDSSLSGEVGGNLTPLGTQTYNDGKWNKGIFVKTDNCFENIDVGDSPSGTVSFWMIHTPVTSSHPVQSPIMLDGDGNGFCMRTESVYKAQYFTYGNLAGPSTNENVSGDVWIADPEQTDPNLEILHHMAITWELGGKVKAYIDNVLYFTSTWTVDVTPRYISFGYLSNAIGQGSDGPKCVDNLKFYKNVVMTDFTYDMEHEE